MVEDDNGFLADVGEDGAVERSQNLASHEHELEGGRLNADPYVENVGLSHAHDRKTNGTKDF